MDGADALEIAQRAYDEHDVRWIPITAEFADELQADGDVARYELGVAANPRTHKWEENSESLDTACGQEDLARPRPAADHHDGAVYRVVRGLDGDGGESGLREQLGTRETRERRSGCFMVLVPGHNESTGLPLLRSGQLPDIDSCSDRCRVENIPGVTAAPRGAEKYSTPAIEQYEFPVFSS